MSGEGPLTWPQEWRGLGRGSQSYICQCQPQACSGTGSAWALEAKARRPLGCTMELRAAGGGALGSKLLTRILLNQCSVYYHFTLNLGWGEGGDDLFFNQVGDVMFGPLAMQKETH